MTHHRWLPLGLAILLALLVQRGWAKDPPAANKDKAAAKAKTVEAMQASTKYLRISRDPADKKKPLALETSIVKFVPADGTRAGLSVDLIGAVHVGEKKYYDALNKTFAEYDVLLFELVAPEGTVIPKGGGEGTGSPVSALQQGMKNLLNLEFQLEQVDYTKKNFVHADMSPEEFAKSMKDRGESFLVLFFRMMGAAMAQQSAGKNQPNDVEILFALFSKDRALRLKQILAGQFEDMGGTLAILEGPDGSTLITERNKKALEVLKKQIGSGKKKIGIFYGAGHMPDLEKRLLADFKLKEKESGVRWLEAWNLRDPVKKPKPVEKAPPKR